MAAGAGELLPPVSVSELQAHVSPDNMWLAIDGVVYDVTKWSASHPGGKLVLQHMAGQDASEAFLAFHGTSATTAGSTARSILPKYAIGRLSNYRQSQLSLDYQQTLREMSSLGLFSCDPRQYLPLGIYLAAAFFASIAGVVLSAHPAVHLAAGLLLGMFWSQVSYVMHDLAHVPLDAKPKSGRYLEILLATLLTGLSPSWWRRSHNAHHVATNDVNFDPDVQLMPFFAVTEKLFSGPQYSEYHDSPMGLGSVGRTIVSYQHWTFYPVMVVGARFNLLLQAFVHYTKHINSSTRLSAKSKSRLSTSWMMVEMSGIACFWIWYSTLLWCLPSTVERLVFVLASCGATALQHVQFSLNHFGCEMRDEKSDLQKSDLDITPLPSNDSSSTTTTTIATTPWVERQLRGTLNIDCSPWLDWLHGGLQFQVEHHLFPLLPRHNLRRAAPFVRQLCLKHHFPYTSLTFFGANQLLISTLRSAALQARLFNPKSM